MDGWMDTNNSRGTHPQLHAIHSTQVAKLYTTPSSIQYPHQSNSWSVSTNTANDNYMQIGHYVLLRSIHIIIIENHEWIVCHPSLLLLHQPLHNQLKFYHSKDGHHTEEAIKTEPTTNKSQNRVHFISTHPKDRTTVLIVNCLLKRRRGSC